MNGRQVTIKVEGLTKVYQVPEREGGFKASVGGFFEGKYRDVQAVQGVSFGISLGEVVVGAKMSGGAAS